MKVCVIIPAYNEESKIGEVIRSVLRYADDVIVVDDASRDKTADVVREAGVKVLRHLVNRGQGAALRTGTRQALADGAEIIVHFDADGQFRAADIPRMIEPIVQGRAEVVLGSRFLDDTTVMPASKRYLIMPLARLINKLFYDLDLTDPQSGFRSLSALAAGRLHWHQDRMAHCSEILALIRHARLKVLEVPITVTYDGYGQKFSGGLKIVRDLFVKGLLR